MTGSLEDLIRYRLDRARETLEDARVLVRSARWNAAVNRLYYACFYAVSAALLAEGLSASKHTGVRGLLNRCFVRTGRVPKDLAKFYNDLFEKRQEGDYLDFVEFGEEQVVPWLSLAEIFVAHMAKLLASHLPSKCPE